MEKTLQLHFAFARHCDIFYVTTTLCICLLKLRFLMTLELSFILVRSNYVLKLPLNLKKLSTASHFLNSLSN